MKKDRNTESSYIKTINRPTAKRIGIVADTHIPDRGNEIDPRIMKSFSKVDLILHGGDITTPKVIDIFGKHAETIAVRGNNRGDRIHFNPPLEEKVIVQISGGYRLGLCHGIENFYQRIGDNLIGRTGFASQCTKRLINRVRTFFKEVNAIIYGHGHWPIIHFDDPLLFINPGKAFGNKSSSYALLEIQNNQVQVKIIPLTPFKNELFQKSEWRVFPIYR